MHAVSTGVLSITTRGSVGEATVVLVMLMMAWSLLVLLMWRKLVGTTGHVTGWYAAQAHGRMALGRRHMSSCGGYVSISHTQRWRVRGEWELLAVHLGVSHVNTTLQAQIARHCSSGPSQPEVIWETEPGD